MSLTTNKADVERKIDEAERAIAESYELGPEDPTVTNALRAQAQATIALARAVLFTGERIELGLSGIEENLDLIRVEVGGR